jgi:hypothetical protein
MVVPNYLTTDMPVTETLRIQYVTQKVIFTLTMLIFADRRSITGNRIYRYIDKDFVK